MRRRAYRSVRVNEVDWSALLRGREGRAANVGMDVAKNEVLVVVRWGSKEFERPWRVANPGQLAVLGEALRRLGEGRALRVALEPSGTYGDALRQALGDVGIVAERVSPKAACDSAETFDGVPSQHDGKDAAVVAELAAQGRSWPWPYVVAAPWSEELGYWVDCLTAQRRIYQLWLGRLEGLLGRHWPEASHELKVSSGVLLRVLERYGSPAALGADARAAEQLTRWGAGKLKADKIERLLLGARTSAGIRTGEFDERRLREAAAAARQARQIIRQAQRHLARVGKGQPVLEAQAEVVGWATAAVLWVSLGDPRGYDSAGAYRKAMGLNLAERSSGRWRGHLKISKRGHSLTRQWLFLAAQRWAQKPGLRRWYEAKKARDQGAMRALVGIMRKLAMALHRVGNGAKFDAARLCRGIVAAETPAGPPRDAAALNR